MAIDDMESAATARRRAGLTASTKNAVKKKTPSKTIVTPGTKVSQATIDKIKAMGMKKALAGAANASPEMREGLKRMYGSSRVQSMASKPAARTADAARAGAMKPSKPVAKSADAARAAATRPAKPVAKTADGARMDALRKSGGQNMPYKASTPATKKNVGSRIADTVTGKNKPKTAAYNAEQAKLLADWKAAKAKKNK